MKSLANAIIAALFAALFSFAETALAEIEVLWLGHATTRIPMKACRYE